MLPRFVTSLLFSELYPYLRHEIHRDIALGATSSLRGRYLADRTIAIAPAGGNRLQPIGEICIHPDYEVLEIKTSIDDILVDSVRSIQGNLARKYSDVVDSTSLPVDQSH